MTKMMTMIARGVCTCGHYYWIFPPEKREMAEQFANNFAKTGANDCHVMVGDRPIVHCPNCGQAIKAPIPETLDPVRYGFGYLFEGEGK